jgi:hypothetical protein
VEPRRVFASTPAAAVPRPTVAPTTVALVSMFCVASASIVTAPFCAVAEAFCT